METLIEILSNASTDHVNRTRIWGKVEHVSKSGNQRSIKLYIVIDGNITEITERVASILDRQVDRHGGITRRGCGMDMVRDTIDLISNKLYKEPLHLRFSYSRL